MLDLQPHSVRAADYQVLAQVQDGSLARIEPGPVGTLRGSLLGVPGSVAAGSLLADGLHARIIFPDDEEYWLEPIGPRVPEAGPDRYVVYQSHDVI
ncbi:MAG: hypothetical protein GTN78_09195, partial [Gemmatimonadales bacterium]|nr:hypothetical protein [Gemmatimonadales bacterium]